jgi:GntR family transcriptional regulator
LTTLHLVDKRSQFKHVILMTGNMLNPESPIPLYHQLASILTGKNPHRSLWSRRPDSIRKPVGRHICYRTSDCSAGHRVIDTKKAFTRKRGSGTYVQSPKKEVDLLSLAGTMSSFHKKGLLTTTKILKKTSLKKLKKIIRIIRLPGKRHSFLKGLPALDTLPY